MTFLALEQPDKIAVFSTSTLLTLRISSTSVWQLFELNLGRFDGLKNFLKPIPESRDFMVNSWGLLFVGL
jgi:hypothetical protein